MGKIRIKTFDESTPEDEAKLKAKREAKKQQKDAAKARVSGMGGGQRVKTVGPSLEELEALEDKNEESQTEPINASDVKEAGTEGIEPEAKEKEKSDEPTKETAKKKTKKEKFVKAKTVGKRHKENLNFVSKTQSYTAEQALETLRKFKKTKFDETVELHINVKEKNISGQVSLPHGTGKKLVIKVADDALIEEISKGKITFDVLVAAPQMMPSLAKVARILGPKGLMPNPKNGTVTNDTDDAVKKLSAGQISYKTEPISPIIHASVGKMSFDDDQLKDNIKTFIKSVGSAKINSITLKSTMSPGIRLTI